MQHRFEIQRTWAGELLAPSDWGWVQLDTHADTLEVCWDAPWRDEPNPNVPTGECMDLWRYQAVEVFLAGPDGPGYLELEFGPAGHWLAFEFSAYRCLLERRNVHSYTWQVGQVRWTGRAVLLEVPLLTRVSRGNAHFVHHCLGERVYCSANGQRGARPDFHRSDLFLPLDGSSSGRV
jgi:hypothetical protein